MKQLVLRKEKQVGRKNWISTCKHLQNGRLRNKWRVFHCYKQIEFYTKTRQINRILFEERRK